MPRLKPSPGKIQLQTPIMDEFQRWLCYELVNAKDWNKHLIEGGLRDGQGWSFSLILRNSEDSAKKLWTITYKGREIHVTSDEPVVEIRKGLRILMGSGRLELSH